MAGALNRLGTWGQEMEAYALKILGNESMVTKYNEINQRIIARSLQLFDTDKPRIAIPLLEYFSNLIKSNQKMETLDQNSPLY